MLEWRHVGKETCQNGEMHLSAKCLYCNVTDVGFNLLFDWDVIYQWCSITAPVQMGQMLFISVLLEGAKLQHLALSGL